MDYIQNLKIMASGSITLWQIGGGKVERVSDFILLDSKVTADGDCSHEIQRQLLLGRKVMTNLERVLKSRDITLPTKVHVVKAMVFPVVMCGCENWTIKTAEHWRTDAFKLWCWIRLGSPLDSKEINPVDPKGNQPWIFTGRTDAETEAPILWPPDVTSLERPWCWERLRAGGEVDNRGWMALSTQWTWVWASSGR